VEGEGVDDSQRMVALLVDGTALRGRVSCQLTESSSTAWRIVDLDRRQYSGGDGLADEVGAEKM
jgi:hypothetical protein